MGLGSLKVENSLGLCPASDNRGLNTVLSRCPASDRPMVVAFPAGDQVHTVTWQFWKNSPILSRLLLDPVNALPSGSMKVIETVDADVVPTTTSLTHTVNAAEKIAQLGPEPYSSLLRGVLTGQTGAGASKPAVLILDLNAHTGDLGQAVFREQFAGSLGGLRLFYLGFHSSEIEASPVAARSSVCVL